MFMNIGIDVDGVILDTENWFRSMSHIYDMHIGGKGPVCPDAVKVQDRMKWSDDHFAEFVENCMYYGMEKAPLMPCCKFVIDKLREMGHRLVLVTARGIFSQKEIDLAIEMLEKNGLKFDAMCFDSQDKLIPCRNENIDYMIDDSANNVIRLSENGIKCLYFRDYGSPDINNDNVIVVANWGEIYKFFTELK